MDIKQKDILKLQDLFFNEKYKLYKYLYNSFNDFIENIIYNQLANNPNVFFETNKDNKNYKYRFIFENITIKPPTIENKEKYMFPEYARKHNLTYSSKILATVKQVQEITDMYTGEKEIKVSFDPEHEIPICEVMVMVKSDYCNTTLRKDKENKECDYDPGCYFIVNGNEKVILGIERMCINKILVFKKKDNSYEDGHTFYATINSKNKTYTQSIPSIKICIKKNSNIVIESSYFKDIPFIIMLRALGINNEKQIFDLIANNKDDIEILRFLTISFNDNVYKINNQEIVIDNQESAILYLINVLKRIKHFKNVTEDIIIKQKIMYVKKVLKNNFLPHLGDDLIKKSYFLCLMVKKLLFVNLNRENPDDRDSYINKRIDLPGELMGQLFKQYYRTMLNGISKFYSKEYSGDNENAINVINQIKYKIIKQGLKNGLATGTWGINKNRKGVSQSLQRYSYLQTISFYRRLTAPSTNASTGKIVSMRHGRNNQYGFICIIETPEGQNIGIHKHLALMASVTINLNDQVQIITDFLEDKIINIYDIHPYEWFKYYKIMINGDWIGFVDNGYNVRNYLIEKRDNGKIHYLVSFILDIKNNELRINTDAGRLVRPLLKVKDNKLLLTKEMLDDIDLDKQNKLKVNNWNTFLNKYPGVIEYIDMEEAENAMISMYVDDLNKNHQIMKTVIKNPNKNGDQVNRYNNTVYNRYSHCEFHPSMMLGSTSSCIPFAEHNQAPRNIYNFSQARQGQGIFATSERYRMDISYRLANPNIPIIQTKGMKYLNFNKLPNGENVIVAIACYTGYNQEDSIIFNQSAIDRGLFRSFVLKREEDEIKKNPSTSQDDTFVKPDPNKVSGIRRANYDKLNQRGYVDKETEINSGDVIIGKISPLQPGSSNDSKIYKDTSKIYKSGEKGVINKVYTNIYTKDGYEMYAMEIRSERVPRVGDKFASRHGQKGIMGLTLLSNDMPFSENGIIPDLIINPQCIPSRMTIGQLLECVLGKTSALEGVFADATPFNKYDIEEAAEKLEKHGFHKYGFETMYCGMTGKKMKSMIFIGPTYYMRLRHLVKDKIHARANGPRNILTRQPPEGRTRDGGLKFGEMERDCYSLNTKVVLNNGLSIKIGDMKNCNWEVLGWNGKGLVKSLQTHYLDKGSKPCLELTLQDGRKLQLTPDHPLLTYDKKWVKAKDLDLNKDRLLVGVNYPLLDLENEIKECDNWSLKLKDIELKTDTKDEYLKTLAFARIIGWLITDGHISHKNEGRVYLGHQLDVKQFLQDLNLFCFKENVCKEKHCFTIQIPQKFMNNILTLDGLMIGNKCLQESKLPSFVFDLPTPILREFFGGMFGGDGHTCYLGLHRGKRDLLSSIDFSKSKEKQYLDSHLKMMNDIKNLLLLKFDIKEVIIQKPKLTTSSKGNDKNLYEVVLHLSINELIPFAEKIGFRYCCHKSQRLEAGKSYKRLRNEVVRQHNWIVNRVDELTNFTRIKREDPKRKVQTKKAIILATNELKEKEGLMHKYVIPTTHDITDHLIKGTKFGKFRSTSFPTAEEFFKDVGALDWFNDYGSKEDKDYLETMNMKIISRKDIGDKPVCDIQVKDTNSFLAEGVVSHNCMIAHGMSLFLKERMVNNSDIYHIHVCGTCGMFVRKKVDKEIHICQICSLRGLTYSTYKVEVPYAFKLLCQELMSINILPKIKINTTNGSIL